jgi:hypothetical protein
MAVKNHLHSSSGVREVVSGTIYSLSGCAIRATPGQRGKFHKICRNFRLLFFFSQKWTGSFLSKTTFKTFCFY